MSHISKKNIGFLIVAVTLMQLTNAHSFPNIEKGKIGPQHIGSIAYEMMTTFIKSGKIDEASLKKIAEGKIDSDLSKNIKDKNYEEQNSDGILSLSMSFNDGSRQVVYSSGLRDPMIDPKAKVDENTLYLGGSVSKFIVMVMAFRAIQDGKLELSNTLSEFGILPNLKNAEKITVDHLLRHYSGLRDDIFAPLSETDNLEKFLVKGENEKIETITEPGEAFFYANANYVAMKDILKKIYDLKDPQKIQSIYDALIGKPLGIEKGLRVKTKTSQQEEAVGYKFSSEALKLKPASDFYISGAADCLITPRAMSVLMHAFFKNDNFLNPKYRNLILDSIKEENFVVNGKDQKPLFEVKEMRGYTLNKEELKLSEEKKYSCYRTAGWVDATTVFMTYCPDLGASAVTAISKTGGLQNNKKPKETKESE